MIPSTNSFGPTHPAAVGDEAELVLGSRFDDKGTFTVWAPHRDRVEVELVGSQTSAAQAGEKNLIEMQPCDDRVDGEIRIGYWQLSLPDIQPGARYCYRLDGTVSRPDPASNFQPDGVHGPSEVIDHRQFDWKDDSWSGVDLKEMIIYELHVGTFTPEGTFASAMEKLAHLKELGVNAIEIMPVAQFPGGRNWGYDGAYPYAVQNSYGGPDRLKELVNACHQSGMAVVLDVVYNHLGPEGNYLRDFGPYFTAKYKTPWGEAMNFDGPYSNPVRDYFIQNALYWFRDYHIDALRLDALHAIFDMSARNFMQELAERVERFSQENGRKFYLIGESDLNDVRLIKPRSSGGYGLDAQWSDDFHHSLHTLLTGEEKGYYRDFGSVGDLAKVFRVGYAYTGQYSKHRKRRHGNSPKRRSARQFVVCIQNHDQVGNRIRGDRLSQLVDFEALKLAAGAVILSPYIPLLFMGEEYGEDSPFAYFVSHNDQDLIESVRRGRQEEFKSFEWQGEIPDPQAVSTFEQSKLYWNRRTAGKNSVLLNFYRKLIGLRKSRPDFADKSGMRVRTLKKKKVLLWQRRFAESQLQCVMNFAAEQQLLKLYAPAARWKKVLDSAETRWLGPGSTLPEEIQGTESVTIPATSIVLYESIEAHPIEQEQKAEQQVPVVNGGGNERSYSHV
jgi:maltooligosyltrehalose trehalohydrolase